MTNTKKTKGGPQTGPPKGDEEEKHELKTDFPLSEKDEVKQAEEKLRKASTEKKRHRKT